MRRYLADAKERMSGLFAPSVLREATRQMELTASMPGVADVAVFDRMSELIVGEGRAFDLVVFDTAPTGHALRLLRMPELMAPWLDALRRRRRQAIDAGAVAAGASANPVDPVLALLDRRASRLGEVRTELTRGDRVSFVLVLIAERLPVEESTRALAQLREAGVHVGVVVVNRLLPEDEPGEYFRARKAQERAYVAEIERRFRTLRRVRVPQLPSDVSGVAGLERVAGWLLADSVAGG